MPAMPWSQPLMTSWLPSVNWNGLLPTELSNCVPLVSQPVYWTLTRLPASASVPVPMVMSWYLRPFGIVTSPVAPDVVCVCAVALAPLSVPDMVLVPPDVPDVLEVEPPVAPDSPVLLSLQPSTRRRAVRISQHGFADMQDSCG